MVQGCSVCKNEEATSLKFDEGFTELRIPRKMNRRLRARKRGRIIITQSRGRKQGHGFGSFDGTQAAWGLTTLAADHVTLAGYFMPVEA